MNENNKGATPKKNKAKKWILLSLGLAATGILSYFGFEYWKKHKQKSANTEDNAPEFKAENPTTPTKPSAKPKAKPTPKTSAKTTNNSSNKNADKQAETPKKENNQDNTTIDAPAIAKALLTAAENKEFIKAITLLRSLKNTSNYSAVNKIFVTHFLNGVRQTIVTGLLNTFTLEAQKKTIRVALLSIGLKYNGKKWTLSGIDNHPTLITKQATKVWKDAKNSVAVPLNMVLGKEIDKRGNYTLFENEKQFFLVESNHVNHYKA